MPIRMPFKDDCIITDLRPEDVVLGRGAGPNEHSGNISFREIVNQLKPEYIGTVNRKEKCHIAGKVVQAVKVRNGRFLKRAPGRPDEVFVLAEESIVMEKAKQALRHGRCTVNPRKGRRRISNCTSLASFSSAPSEDLSNVESESTMKHACADAAAKILVSPLASPALAKTLVAACGSAVLPSPPVSRTTLHSSRANPTVDSFLTSMDDASYETCLQMLMALAEAKRSNAEECIKICTLIETLIVAKRMGKAQQQHQQRLEREQQENRIKVLLDATRAASSTTLQQPASVPVEQALMSKLPQAVVADKGKNALSPTTSPLSTAPSSPSVTGLSASTLDWTAKLEQFLPGVPKTA